MRTRTAPRPAAGFTLLEILVVVAIISILAIFLVGGEGRLRRNTLMKTTADHLVGSLYTAKNLAISNNAVYEVKYTPPVAAIPGTEVTDAVPGVRARVAITRAGETAPVEVCEIDNLIGVSTSLTTPITFNPDGSIFPATSTATFTLQEGDARRVIEVSLAGMIKLKNTGP